MLNVPKNISVGLLAIAFLYSSCKDNSNPVSKIDDVVFPESKISYNRHIQPLWNIACAVSGCHDSHAVENKTFELTSYYFTRYYKPGVVIPLDTNCILVRSLDWKPEAKWMPLQRKLTVNQITGIKKWILEGATDTIR